ncbi:MAG: methyl-accepting chemotaxis protein [Lachnospiraceae bacterium]|nr:methyl-accepting chemotaxis protein [Lachnospiraceae bacterium]
MALNMLKEKKEKAPKVKKYRAPKEKKVKELKLPKEKKVKEPKVKKEKLPKAEKPVKEKREGKFKLPKFKLPKFNTEKIKLPAFLKKNRKPITENKKRVFTLSLRLLLLCLLPMALACLMITMFSANRLRASIEDEIEKSLKIVTASVNETYTTLYEGDYVVDLTGRVTKGGVQITADNRLIDSIKEKTGLEVSFLFGNSRTITTVRNPNGARANGIGIPKDNYARIENSEEFFVTGYSVAGNLFYAYYQPLVNSDGTVVGAIEAAVDSSSVNKTINGQIWGIVLFSLVFVVIAAVAVVLLSKGLVKGLTAIRAYLHKIANGDLGAQPEVSMQNRDDELGDIYRMAIRLQTTLRQIVNEIKASATRLNESADQLTDMAQNTNNVVEDVIRAVAEISEGAKQQADDTSETNDSIMRMSRQIESIVEDVENLNVNATKMAQEETESERIINELNASNNETKEAVMQVAEQITVMSDSIRHITGALDMIRNVADETTLLALNASIEAARVGEAGRGFAVVAQQINKLAEQSNSSIGKIEAVIDSVVSTSERMVDIMADVKGKMEQQQEKLDETMQKSVAVAGEVENSKQKIEVIRGNVDNLNEFGNTIGGAVSNLAAVSYENAASADNTKESADAMSTTMNELRDASEKLVELSKELEQSLGLFKL